MKDMGRKILKIIVKIGMSMMDFLYRNPNSSEGIGLNDGVSWSMDEIEKKRDKDGKDEPKLKKLVEI